MQALKASTKCKHKTQALNANTKRTHPTLPQNATSNGGDASRVGKRSSYHLAAFVFSSFLYPDARRVALSLQQLSGAAANLQTLLNRTL